MFQLPTHSKLLEHGSQEYLSRKVCSNLFHRGKLHRSQDISATDAEDAASQLSWSKISLVRSCFRKTLLLPNLNVNTNLGKEAYLSE